MVLKESGVEKTRQNKSKLYLTYSETACESACGVEYNVLEG